MCRISGSRRRPGSASSPSSSRMSRTENAAAKAWVSPPNTSWPSRASWTELAQVPSRTSFTSGAAAGIENAFSASSILTPVRAFTPARISALRRMRSASTT